MASTSAVPVRSSRVRAKHVIFVVLGLMFLFVLWHDDRFIIDHSHRNWAYYFPVRWLILPHGLAGLTALLIGPFQLSSRFRQRHLQTHRIMGRIYLVSIVVAALFGIYLSATHQKQLQAQMWIFALAGAWLTTGLLAFVAVRNGNIEAHQQWVTRNYAFTCVFITARALGALPIPSRYGDASAWILLLASLLFAEVCLSWQSTFTNRRARRVSSAHAAAP